VIQGVFESKARGRRTDLAAALGFVAGTQRRRAVVVVVSDFLDDGPWQRVMGTLVHRHRVHAVVVHDPLDRGIGLPGLYEVVDAETGRAMLVDGASFAGADPVEARVEGLRRLGARSLAISTADDPFRALQRHFQSQAARR
jgi:hypothetical protein